MGVRDWSGRGQRVHISDVLTLKTGNRERDTVGLHT